MTESTRLTETMIRFGGTDMLGEADEKVWAALAENPDGIVEASIGRIYQHWRNNEFGIVSAWRGNFDDAENTRRAANLATAISGAGLGYIRLRGYGGEAGEVQEEDSYLVVNGARGGAPIENFRELLVSWGRQFDQDSVLHHMPGEATHLLGLVEYKQDPVDATKSQRIPLGEPAEWGSYPEFVPGVRQYYSQLWRAYKRDQWLKKQDLEPEQRGTFAFVDPTQESEEEPQLKFLRFADEPHNWMEGMMFGAMGDLGFEPPVYGTCVENFRQTLGWLRKNT